jgi:hypothetical protein
MARIKIIVDAHGMTFGDFEETPNVKGASVQYRCGICDSAFHSAEARERHHKDANEQKYKCHKPVRCAGSLCYYVDAQGCRVSVRGKRY